MRSHLITIVKGDVVTEEPLEAWRTADHREDNMVLDSREAAIALAKRTVPARERGAWAVWSTGVGGWAVREALPTGSE